MRRYSAIENILGAKRSKTSNFINEAELKYWEKN